MGSKKQACFCQKLKPLVRGRGAWGNIKVSQDAARATRAASENPTVPFHVKERSAAGQSHQARRQNAAGRRLGRASPAGGAPQPAAAPPPRLGRCREATAPCWLHARTAPPPPPRRQGDTPQHRHV